MRKHHLLVALFVATSLTPAIASAQDQSLPANLVTERAHDGPQGDRLRPSVQALQQTLIELQQLKLQLKQAH